MNGGVIWKLDKWKSGNWMFQVSNVRYSGDMKSGLVWISNTQKEVDKQMVQILNGVWNSEAQPFEIQTNGHQNKKPQNVQISYGLFLSLAQPFENWTIWNPIFKKSGFWMFMDYKLSYFRSPLYWDHPFTFLAFFWSLFFTSSSVQIRKFSTVLSLPWTDRRRPVIQRSKIYFPWRFFSWHGRIPGKSVIQIPKCNVKNREVVAES